MCAQTIDFDLHAAPTNAEYVRISSDEVCDDAEGDALVTYALDTWQLDAKPGLLIRVTGSVADDNSGRHGNEVACTLIGGVVQAASTASAWASLRFSSA